MDGQRRVPSDIDSDIEILHWVEDKLLPPWQGIQYLENMVSGKGKLDSLDNDKYPELVWTTMEQALKEADGEKAKSA